MCPILFRLPEVTWWWWVLLALFVPAVFGYEWYLRPRLTGRKRPSLSDLMWTAGVWSAAAVAFVFISFKWGPVPLHSYGLMLALGVIAGIWVGQKRAHLAGLTPNEMIDFGLLALVWGLAGARIFYVMERHSRYFGSLADFKQVFAVWKGGLVFYGGMVGGASYIAYYILRQHHGWKWIRRLADATSPSLGLGLAFGRIGCFLNGCCFGTPSSLPWAVTFPRDSILWYMARRPSGHPSHRSLLHAQAKIHGMVGGSSPPARTFTVHPTQLYNSINALVSFLVSSYVLKHKKFHGQAVLTLLVCYSVGRFMTEFLRGEQLPFLPAISSWTTIAQYLSMAVFALAAPPLTYYTVKTWNRPPLAAGCEGNTLKAPSSNRETEQAE